MFKFPIKSFEKIVNGYYFAAKHQFQSFSSSHLAQPIQHEENWEKAKPYKSVPGPSTLQLICRFMPGGKYNGVDLTEWNRKIRAEYGNIAKLPGMFGNTEIIIIYDPNDFERVFRNEGQWPYRRGIATFDHYRKDVRPDIFKDMGGLISEQGEPWAKMRSIVSPILLKPVTVNAYIKVVDEITMEFLNRAKTMRDEQNELPANFMYLLNTWALESISFIALNQRLHILMGDKDSDTKAKELIQSVDDFFKLTYELEMKPSLWRYIKTPQYKQLMKTFDCMTMATLHYIDRAIDDLEKNPPSSEETQEPSVLEKLLKVDKHAAVVMAVDMMVAGVDTTSSSAANLLYHLSKNQDKQDRLREEIKNLPFDKNGTLKPSSFAKIPYLRACMKEAMRLTPITSGTSRAVARDIVIKGYKIPQGTHVIMANILLHHDEKEFKDPEKFMPERWLNEKLPNACPEAKASHPFVYLPFGFGPRSCVGKRIAEMEINILITRLLQKYRVDYNYGSVKYRNSFIISPISEMKFKLTEL